MFFYDIIRLLLFKHGIRLRCLIYFIDNLITSLILFSNMRRIIKATAGGLQSIFFYA